MLVHKHILFEKMSTLYWVPTQVTETLQVCASNTESSWKRCGYVTKTGNIFYNIKPFHPPHKQLRIYKVSFAFPVFPGKQKAGARNWLVLFPTLKQAQESLPLKDWVSFLVLQRLSRWHLVTSNKLSEHLGWDRPERSGWSEGLRPREVRTWVLNLGFPSPGGVE